MNQAQISNEDLLHLKDLPLSRLTLNYYKNLNEGLKHLKDLPLHELKLEGWRSLSDDNLANLSTSLTNLHILYCEKIHDEGIKHLELLTSLRSLKIKGCSLTDQSFSSFEKLPLKHLSVLGNFALTLAAAHVFEKNTGLKVDFF